MGAPSNWPSWLSGPLEYIAGYKKREFRDATLSSSMLPGPLRIITTNILTDQMLNTPFMQ